MCSLVSTVEKSLLEKNMRVSFIDNYFMIVYFPFLCNRTSQISPVLTVGCGLTTVSKFITINKRFIIIILNVIAIISSPRVT